MLVEYHQRVPSLQRKDLQHKDMVRHQASLDDFYPLVLTEPPEGLPKVGPYVVAGDFVPILRRDQDVVFAHPLRVQQAVGLLGQTSSAPSPIEFLAT